MQSDNGGEYGSKTLNGYLKQRGIMYEMIEPYTSQQNRICCEKQQHFGGYIQINDAVYRGPWQTLGWRRSDMNTYLEHDIVYNSQVAGTFREMGHREFKRHPAEIVRL